MKSILVVDDDPDIIVLVKNRLEDNNYRVISASDGNEGILKAQQQRPDLIVMDVMMPNMLGGDAVRLLKADDKTRNIPIIFLTAVTAHLSKSSSDSQSINVDGQFYKAIAKPFRPAELLIVINSLTRDGGKESAFR